MCVHHVAHNSGNGTVARSEKLKEIKPPALLTDAKKYYVSCLLEKSAIFTKDAAVKIKKAPGVTSTERSAERVTSTQPQFINPRPTKS